MNLRYKAKKIEILGGNMINIERNSLLKDTPEYEEMTENYVNLSLEEMKELGLSPSCGCSSGGCCKNKKR